VTPITARSTLGFVIISRERSSNRPPQLIHEVAFMGRKFDIRDVPLRVLLVAAGVVAAVLFVREGQAQVLPALAVGATIGVLCMTGVQTREER
jgi:hypothetical protein